ncbi:MAG TPA: 50S ribosomal protein L13 [Polyangiaceae bacterium]|jgi:large subunit ribosomal protein L13
MRTFVAKPADAAQARAWWVIDAKGQPLGRLASRIAVLLRGKHKPTFTPHVDTGDFVVVINASNVKVTGRKAESKMYYRHSGHPGHLKGESFRHLAARRPDVPIRQAVKGMLPKNVLGRQLLGKLKIYQGAEHPHQAQKPQPLSP